MTPEERRAYERRILDHHEHALRAQRETDEILRQLAIDMRDLRDTLDAMIAGQEAAGLANRKAIDEALAANRAALGLHNESQ